MKYIIRALHAFLCILAIIPFFVAMVLFALGMFISLVADKVWPEADWGNCWSFSSVQWFKRGGGLHVRPSVGLTILGAIPVPHATWIERLHPEPVLLRTEPVHRRMAKWFPWFFFYFPYTLVDNDGHAESQRGNL